MKNKVENLSTAVFQFATSSVHLATALNLAMKEFETNSSPINFFYWPNRTRFPNRMAKRFSLGIFSDIKMLEKFEKAFTKVHFTDKFDRKIIDQHSFQSLCKALMDIDKMQDLRQLNDIFPGIGSALANQVASNLGINFADKRYRKLALTKLIFSFLNVFKNTEECINQFGVKRAFIFNGRFLHERAAWEACKARGIETRIFENTRDRFHLSKDGFHNRVINQKRILDCWDNSDLSLAVKMHEAQRYFDSFHTKSNPFFTSEQASGLPQKHEYVSYFSNSDSEAIGFWESWQEPFGSQLDAVESLVQRASSLGIQIVIRLHPNVIRNSGDEVDKWMKFSTRQGVFLILDEKTSSYDVMKQSLGVISYGSTIGIEAAWSGIPVAVLADCKYDLLGFATKLSTPTEITNWLIELKKGVGSGLSEERRIAAGKWGFFVENGGSKLENCVIQPGPWGAYEVLSVGSLNLKIGSLAKYASLVYFRLRNWYFWKRRLRLEEKQTIQVL